MGGIYGGKYFQSRISKETFYLFSELKDKYENIEGKNITQADVISRAVSDVKRIENWNLVINDSEVRRSVYKVEVKDKNLRIRVQISPEIENSIHNYKHYLVKFTKSRSLTVGRTLNYIFVGALQVLNNNNVISSDLSYLDNVFKETELKLKNLIAPLNHELFDSIFEEMKSNIYKIKN